MSDRERILARVRRAARHTVPHPGAHPTPEISGALESFGRALRAAGGEVDGPRPRAELGTAIRARAAALAAARVLAQPSAAALLEPFPGGVAVAAEGALPHAFAGVQLGVARGELGVAENGAVAVLGRDAPHRALLFLAEHLVLLLPASHLVPDLHSAFRALPADALEGPALTWIAGPSKTADIEQTLVFGAHGPRSLLVVLFD